MTVTAAWPLPRLVSALARAGWAELEGRQGGALRQVLRAFCDLLPHGSATGLVTAHQLAAAAGISERWTRDRLALLEAAGIITWTRGGIVAGRPTPSLVKVSKRALADLVRRARPINDAAIAARAAATAERIRTTLRTFTLHRSQPRRSSTAAPVRRRVAALHAELSAALPPIGEETKDSVPVMRTLLNQPRPPRGPRAAALRAILASSTPPVTP